MFTQIVFLAPLSPQASSDSSVLYIFCSKNLTTPDMFPLSLWDEELEWKIQVNYDVTNDTFLLAINDIAFFSMPCQTDIIPNGPQKIERGTVKLDGDEVSNGSIQLVDFVDRVFDDKRQPPTEIHIDGFETTSSETVNSVIGVLGRAIDAEQGLKRLSISGFWDTNELQGWPLEQLVLRSSTLLSLRIDSLDCTTPVNRSLILDFAA